MQPLRTHLRSFFARFSYGARIRPERDWRAILALAALALAGIIGWNLWAFGTIVNGGTLGGAPAAPPTSVDQASIAAVRQLFTDRANEDGRYADGIYQFTDPSQ